MNCNFNTFALSKKSLLVKNVVSDFTSMDETVKNLDCENMRIPILIQFTLMKYGKSLTDKAFVSLCHSSENEQISLATDIEDYLKDLYGDFGTFDSLFGNFPNTVLNMSEFEMAIHTLVQYYTDGAYFPKDFNITEGKDSEDTTVDWNLCVKDKYDMIDAIDYEGLGNLYKVLLSSNQSIISFDKDAIRYLGSLKNIGFESEYFETTIGKTWNVINSIENIPFKETLCFVIDTLSIKPKTITDVLRYTVYLSGGDVSLPVIPKNHNGKFHFKNFSRKERKNILNLMENILATNKGLNTFAIEEMKKYLSRWIRLGEVIHPFEYTKKFPATASAFGQIRNNANKIKTWNSKVDEARKEFNFEKLMKLYSMKPGEFARALDSLIRLFGEDDNILDEFKNVISEVSDKVIFEVSEHFFTRTKKEKRFISPKGTRTVTELRTLEPISEKYVDKILTMFVEELVNRVSKKESLSEKSFFLSEKLKNINLPTNMRSMNVGNIVIPRGSRIPLPETKDLLRFYCHWIDEHGCEDIDLAAIFVDNNGKENTISWNTSFFNDFAIFSGDCRHHKGNCAEYIDISFDKAIKSGMKYAILVAADYEGHNFNFPSYAGFMARDEWGTPGENTWSPETVESEFKITSNCQKVVMGIIDFENREYIMVDEDLNGIPVAVTQNNSVYKSIFERYTKTKFWNVQKLLTLNIFSRGGNCNYQLTEDEISKMKSENEEAILEINKSFNSQVEYLKSLGLSEEDFLMASENLKKETDNALKEKNNNIFISFDDIAKDYSFILEWMN